MEMSAARFILSKRPVGMPEESDFGLERTLLSGELKEGEIRLHGLYYSVDPYMRGRMSETKSPGAPYALYALDEPIEGGVVARVVDSRDPVFKAGDLVFGQLPWATEIIVTSSKIRKIDTSCALASEYLGILGMTGLTAYFGLSRIGRPKAGETVVISGAAGAVGSVAGQIAKIKDCRVIGIVGSDDKAKLLKGRFGFDVAMNYKSGESSSVTEDLASRIRGVCPEGIDVYFDNVGGAISDAVMQNMNFQGRVVLCGQISLSNAEKVPLAPRIQPLILSRSLLMQGFRVSDFQAQFSEGVDALSKWLTEGRLESTETIIEGFDNLPRAFIGLFSGKNIGKMIVKASAA